MALRQLFMYEPMKKYPELFNIRLTRIPFFLVNMTNNWQSKAKRSKLFVFLTICIQSRIIIWLWTIHNFYTRITQIIIWILTHKWPNIIQYSAFALPTIRLRYQSFGICLDVESRSGTPLRRNLVNLHFFVKKTFFGNKFD